VHFTYRSSAPLPQRSDGRFETSVTVAGIVQIDPSTHAARRADLNGDESSSSTSLAPIARCAFGHAARE